MKNVLFINSSIKECGVYQYGKRTFDAIKDLKDHNLTYLEISSTNEYINYLKTNKTDIIIYNNHGPIMPWLSAELIKRFPQITHIGILHEGPGAFSYGYDYFISQDPTIIDEGNVFSVPRPLINCNLSYRKNDIITINSFGFSFGDKGFEKVVKIVCEQFDEAIINLHMPTAHFNRPIEENQKVFDDCKNSLTNPNVKLNITTNFLSETELLNFLASGDINFFPYDEHKGRGVSSVIDYALSVNRPIAITNSEMFRHIINTQPSICIENRSLIQIIESGIEPLQKWKDLWSNEKIKQKYSYIINNVSEK